MTALVAVALIFIFVVILPAYIDYKQEQNRKEYEKSFEYRQNQHLYY